MPLPTAFRKGFIIFPEDVVRDSPGICMEHIFEHNTMELISIIIPGSKGSELKRGAFSDLSRDIRQVALRIRKPGIPMPNLALIFIGHSAYIYMYICCQSWFILYVIYLDYRDVNN